MGAKAAELSDATGPVGGIVARATVATVFGPYTQLEAGFPLATALQSGPTPAALYWQADPVRVRELPYRSLQLNANSATVLGMATRSRIAFRGRLALELLYRAERLPTSAERGRGLIKVGLASAYLCRGRLVKAIAACGRGLNQNRRNAPTLRILAACLIKQKRQSEAADIVRQVLEAEPQPTLTRLRERFRYLMMGKIWNEYSRHCVLPDYLNTARTGPP
jgi:tetratricopeptide (TPR) repeat protein